MMPQKVTAGTSFQTDKEPFTLQSFGNSHLSRSNPRIQGVVLYLVYKMRDFIKGFGTVLYQWRFPDKSINVLHQTEDEMVGCHH